MRMTRARYSEELLYNQKGGVDHQHVEERGHHPHDNPDEKTAQVSDIRGLSGKRHQASVILLQSLASVQTEPTTETRLQTHKI